MTPEQKAKIVRGHVTSSVLEEVGFEVERQHTKWGEQNWPDGTGTKWSSVSNWLDPARAKERCNEAMRYLTCTYALIFVEEAAEALFETSKRKLRKELVQVAAVCVSWIKKIDRDLARGEE